MSLKLFCDRCDKVIKGAGNVRIVIKINPDALFSLASEVDRTYDLCSECHIKLLKENFASLA